MAEQYPTETSAGDLEQPPRLSVMETSEDYSIEEDIRDDQLPKTDYSEGGNSDLISLTQELQPKTSEYPTLPLTSDLEDYLNIPLKDEPQGNLIPETFAKLSIMRERKDNLIPEDDSAAMECDQICFEMPESWNDNLSNVIYDFERPNEFARRRIASETVVVKPSESSPVAFEFAVNISVKKSLRSVKLRRACSTSSLHEIEGTEHLTAADVIQGHVLGACSSKVSDELEDVKRKFLESKKDLDKQLELRNRRLPKQKLSPEKTGTSSEISPQDKKLKDVAERINELIEIYTALNAFSQNLESSSEMEVSDKNGKPKISRSQNLFIVAGGALCAVAGAHTIIAQESSKGKAIGIAMLLLGYTMFLRNL